jgi:uncharacterized membrane protein YedE/YeeE
MERSERFWNPYLAGIALGLVLLGSFVISGHGLGASGAAHKLAVFGLTIVAPKHVEKVPALRSATEEGSPLDDWLVFEILGVVLGGAVAAYTSGRMKPEVLRGAGVSVAARLLLAMSGGLLMGMAARMARGCTSGQALSGGAMLSVGSWLFMFAVFGGGYAMAWFVRREWR